METRLAAHTLSHEAPVTTTAADGMSMTREEINRFVAQGRVLRAEAIRAWGQQLGATWTTLFNRHGHMLPTHAQLPS